MSTMAQVQENLNLAGRSLTESFTSSDLSLIANVREKYHARIAIPCTKCGYCMPCPNGVYIPANFDFFNYAHLYDDVPVARMRYQVFLTEAERSSVCIACGVCESLCPQKIEISQWMPKVTALLS